MNCAVFGCRKRGRVEAILQLPQESEEPATSLYPIAKVLVCQRHAEQLGEPELDPIDGTEFVRIDAEKAAGWCLVMELNDRPQLIPPMARLQ